MYISSRQTLVLANRFRDSEWQWLGSVLTGGHPSKCQAFLLSPFSIPTEFIDSTEQLEDFDLEEDFEILSV